MKRQSCPKYVCSVWRDDFPTHILYTLFFLHLLVITDECLGDWTIRRDWPSQWAVTTVSHCYVWLYRVNLQSLVLVTGGFELAGFSSDLIAVVWGRVFTSLSFFFTSAMTSDWHLWASLEGCKASLRFLDRYKGCFFPVLITPVTLLPLSDRNAVTSVLCSSTEYVMLTSFRWLCPPSTICASEYQWWIGCLPHRHSEYGTGAQ